MAKSIRILHYALDDSPLRGGTVIVRGVIDPISLEDILTDDYQREAMPLTPRSRIFQGLTKGEPFPDVELGMRGERMMEKNNTLYLQDDTYIIDGLQRISGAIRFLSLRPGSEVRLGATIHLNTTKEWEKERFEVLNISRVKVSPNILLRNRRDNSPVLASLFDISSDDTRFVLHQRVSWEQRMNRNDLITAMMLLKVFGSLHRHFGGSGRSERMSEMVPQMDRTFEKLGPQFTRENMRTFFSLLDECWGVKMIQYRDTATQLRGTFMIVLAKLLSDHEDFWSSMDKRLVISPELRKKLASFPLADPTVVSLAAASGKAGHMLYSMMKDHLNSGKRTNHLKIRKNVDTSIEQEAAE